MSDPEKGLTIEDIKRSIDEARAIAGEWSARQSPPQLRYIPPAAEVLNDPGWMGWTMACSLAGVRVYVQQNWPKVQRGTRKRRFPAHPAILWLARKLGAPAPWFARGAWRWTYQEIEVPNLVDIDPVLIDGAIHLSAAQWNLLKTVLKANG
jgi:hypothetical protein